MSETVKCLAVRQPWAWALVTGAKDIENRSWTTAYRGPVVIQASAAKTIVNQVTRSVPSLPPMTFTYSALIGVVEVLDVVPLSPELEANPWAWGSYCWRVGNARSFAQPIPAKGKLNLYSLAPDLAERARIQIDGATVVSRDAVASAWLGAMTHLDSDEERLRGLFDSYLRLEDSENALRLAERLAAEEHSGNTAKPYIYHAQAKLVGKHPDFAGALGHLNRALTMDPTDALGFFLRSLAYDGLAEDDRHKAAQLDPRFADPDHPASPGDKEVDGD